MPQLGMFLAQNPQLGFPPWPQGPGGGNQGTQVGLEALDSLKDCGENETFWVKEAIIFLNAKKDLEADNCWSSLVWP